MSASSRPVSGSAVMSERIADIEVCLRELDAALSTARFEPIEQASTRLHRSLLDSMSAFSHTTHPDSQAVLDAEQRQRLIVVQARVLSQLNAVQKASQSIGRTLGVLLPREEASTYGVLAQSPAARGLQAYR